MAWTGVSVRCALVGKASVEHDVVTLRTGLVSCANGTGEMALALKGDLEGMVLSWLRSALQWVSAVRGSLPMLMLSSSTTRVESSLVSKLLPPGSYTNLLLLLEPTSLRLCGWLVQLLLLLRTPMLSLLSRAGLPPMSALGWLSLLLGTRAGSGFVIGLASLFSVLVMSVCSCIWRLFGLASVISVGGGGVAAIGEGGGSGSSWAGDVDGGGEDDGSKGGRGDGKVEGSGESEDGGSRDNVGDGEGGSGDGSGGKDGSSGGSVGEGG